MKRRELLQITTATIVAAGLPGSALASTPTPLLKPPKKGPISVAFVVGEGGTVIDFAGQVTA